MPITTDLETTPERYFRSVILYGRNVATYKFALGQALLQLAQEGHTYVTLEQLSEPFSANLLNHLQLEDKQGTSGSSRFLTACRQHLAGELSHEALLEATVKLGFVNVIDAFHVVGGHPVPVRFFEDDRSGQGGLHLTDELLRLPVESAQQHGNLQQEVEGRWRLVETAWALGLPAPLLNVQHDEDGQELFVLDKTKRRKNVTSARNALDGYQQGRCFYCEREVSIDPLNVTADVDHFFPHTLMARGLKVNLNGVWNLVLACAECNRGEAGKFALLPAPYLIERLYQRNEYLIGSHHPLRETLINQVGPTPETRKAFLQRLEVEAVAALVHRWSPVERYR